MSRLAIEGGRPVRGKLFPPWPVFASDEIGAAARVLRSGRVNYWTGPEGANFEREFARWLGAEHAVALSNGTVGLETALAALEIGPGDEVIVPSRSFVASAGCVSLRGAKPVFAEVDARSQGVTAETIAGLLTVRTRAAIVVHLGGYPAEIAPIIRLARERGFWVVEDCAQSQGALYRERPTGTFGDIGVFSFCQDKIMTTGGEGGMLVTASAAIIDRARAHKDHGKNYRRARSGRSGGGFRWLHDRIGSNYRMTGMQAAIGSAQLKKVDRWLRIRRRNAARLDRLLAPVPGLRLVSPPPETVPAYYRYYLFVETGRLGAGWNRDRILEAVRAEGVPCGTGSCPEIYREKAFRRSGLAPEKPHPVARRMGRTSLALPVHPTLTGREMEETAAAVGKVMRAACRRPSRKRQS